MTAPIDWQKELNFERNCGPPSDRMYLGKPKSLNHVVSVFMIASVLKEGNFEAKAKPEWPSAMAR